MNCGLGNRSAYLLRSRISHHLGESLLLMLLLLELLSHVFARCLNAAHAVQYLCLRFSRISSVQLARSKEELISGKLKVKTGSPIITSLREWCLIPECEPYDTGIGVVVL